ncbi:MAG: nuclear transport factor 2 family protein [Croceibacterium sp.]
MIPTGWARTRRGLAFIFAASLAGLAPLSAQPAIPPNASFDALARDVSRVESLRQIKTVQRLYAQYAQYGLWDQIGGLFASTARFTFDGQVKQGQTMAGPAQIAAFLRGRYGGGHEGLQAGDTRLLLMDAPLVTIAPNGREATGRWSVLNFIGGGGKAAIEGGIANVDYRQLDGVWKIVGVRYYPQYSGPYESGWTNWGGGDLPVVPYHFTPADAGLPILPAETPASPAAATLAELSARIAALTDEDAVRNLQAAYGYYADRKMWPDVADLFAADGAVQVSDRSWRGRAGVRRWLASLGPAGLKHGQLNDRPQFDMTVTVAPGGREAWARGIELGLLGEGDQEKGWWEAAAFRNRFVKDGGVWKIRELRRFSLFKADYDLGWGRDLAARPPHAPMPAFATGNPVTGALVAPLGEARIAAQAPLTGTIMPGPARLLSLAEAQVALRRSLAFDSIENVSAAYQAYLDDFKSDNFSALLATKGFKMSAFAGYYVGRERVAEAGRRVWGPEPVTRAGISFHWRVQPVILVSDDGRSANMRVRLFQPRTGKDVGAAGGFYGAYFYSGMYHDQFVLEDGVWKMWNLSLDEPYMSNVAWKVGWARAKDPTVVPTAAPSVLVRPDSTFKPDVPVAALGARERHFRGGTGDPWQWPTILPMWFEYRNPVSGRVPEHYQADCVPCLARPDLRLDRNGYQQPPVWPQKRG